MRQKSLPMLIILGLIFGGLFEKYCKSTLKPTQDIERVVVTRVIPAPAEKNTSNNSKIVSQELVETITSKTVSVKGPKHLRNCLHFLKADQIKELEGVFKKKNIHPATGHKLFFSLKQKGVETQIAQLRYYIRDHYFDIKVGEKITATKVSIQREMCGLSGVVTHSFYHAALHAGAPQSIVSDCVLGLKQCPGSFKKGSPFKIVYDTIKMPNGYEAMPRLKYIEFQTRGKEYKLYAFEPQSGHREFFTEKGLVLKKRGFEKPIKIRHARISSGFGWRIHPITNRRHFHQGIDIQAPRGTYIVPAAPGRVIFAGWKGGYGRAVEVSHGNGFVTRYGHMQKIMVKPGMHVNTSMSLGTVGDSGLASGPHLHFEVHQNKKPINPKGQIYMPQQKLYGTDYKKFCDLKRSVKKCLAYKKGSNLIKT